VAVEVKLHSFLTSALYGDNGQLHASVALTTERETAVPTEKRGWLGPTGGLNLFDDHFCITLPQITNTSVVQPDWLFSGRRSS
jgi:hypothetical protein